MSKKNPLKLIEPMTKYDYRTAPIKLEVIDRLLLQRYIKKVNGSKEGKRVKCFFLTYKGEAARGRNVLPGWEGNTSQVNREINGIEATALLYGQPKK